MDADQVRHWSREGMEFGAHSRTHPDLTHCDAATLAEEVEASRRELADIVQRPVDAFAYPYGRYDDAVTAAVSASFTLAFTMDRGLVAADTSPYRIPRITIQPGDRGLGLMLRLRGGGSRRRGLLPRRAGHS
jgi:peptidoglycan/xylan/chitin deacetylase (PgdA/CDA1 family)